jgi:hypothetical protein
MSGSANPTVVQSNTHNGNIPQVSRVYTFSLALVSGSPVQFDLRSLQNSNQFKDAQGIYVDNSANTTAVSITEPSGIIKTIPAQSQGMLPLYLPSANPVIGLSGSGTVNFNLINFPTPAMVWSVASSNIPVTGGFAQVSDPTLQGLLTMAEGSLAGGTPAQVSFAVGGIYNTALPTLTNGQQSALQLSSNGSALVATAPMTAAAPATFTVVVAGTAVNAFPAGSIVNGAIIVNPSNAGESLWVDLVNTAQTASPGTNGTTFEIPAGSKFTVPGSMVGAVSVNAVTAGHTFAATRF